MLRGLGCPEWRPGTTSRRARMPRAAWGLAVLLALAGATRPALAQPAPPPPETDRLGLPPPEPSESATTPVPHSNKPPPILGAPVGPAREEPRPTASGPVTPASFPEPTPDTPRRAAGLGAPLAAGGTVPARVVEPAQRSTPAPAADPVAEFLTKRSALRDKEPESSDRSSGKFWDWCHGVLGNKTEWFKSDHVFDGFISPVTNPFLFEDPRSLT